MGEAASGVPARGPGHGGSARGYSWPAFTAEWNVERKTTHGARSLRVYQPLARELAAGIVAERPYLARYPEAVAAWAEYEARADLLRRWLAGRDVLDGEGDGGVSPKVTGALKLLATMERGADRARQRLGLDPRADVELARARAEAATLAVDLTGIAEAGRRALAGRGVEVVEVERGGDGG